MALITTVISEQRFEKVRDLIGSIIAVELANQASLLSDDTIDADVWVSRRIPFDKADLPAINVMFGEGMYDNRDMINRDGHYTYYIDIYTRSEGEDGDQQAVDLADRIAGIVSYILSHPAYKRLGQPAPFNCSTAVRTIKKPESYQQANIENVNSTRIEFEVRIVETVGYEASVELISNDTTVKLELTDKGYKYMIAEEEEII